ncbi:uncharacterized protein LOC131854079 [Achroia grisella]|uniref:uncharacterized protein LOC131854079 n=1 Tax=Achroia grisella TaxID=688607 RepID=UPI0027D2FA7E|nr:uncharacterized protein LOC131854079 [Achroia grisella]
MEAQSNEENTAAVTSPVAATPTVAATTSPAAATTSTTTTYTSSEPTATTETSAETSAETTTTIPRAPRTTASKKKKELAKAREELLRKEVELAAARVAALEADTDDEEEDENEEDAATLRRERTTDWIRRTSTLALTMEPHTERTTADLHQGINISSIPAGEGTKAPQPQPCSDAFRRDHASHNGPREDSIAPMMPTKKEEDSLKGGIDYKELATAMTMAARAIQPSTVPRVTELPPFNGASSEWLPWKMAYEESAGQLTEQENLGRLRRCLKGAAKEAAHCLFVGDTSAVEVIQLLATRFGRPGALVMAEMNKLRALPRLSDNPKDICLFASRIANVTATIQALKKNHYLYNEEVTRSITEKMPSALRFKYYDFVAEQPADQPDLITLSKFLQITAARCGDFAPAEVIVNEDRREPATKRSVKTYITQEKPTSPPCPTCNREGHAPPDCITVKNAEPQARWEIAKKHRLCFRCLRIKRFRHNCKTKRCNVGGCTHLHHPLLHVDTIEKKDSEPSDDKAAAVVASAREDKKIAFLKIVPIQVIGPKGTCDTYALLDDGATCTIIEEATAKQIGATGPPAPFYIEAVAGTRINADESKLVHFTIRGRRSEDHAVSARTMKKLLLSPQTVSRGAIEDCPHLYDIIDQLTYEEGQPTVLLGQDNWHLLLAHEVRRGNKTQPVASLTDLGWVLHGTGAARARQQVHRISHLVDGQENEESIERLMKEHFALESLGVTPRRYIPPSAPFMGGAWERLVRSVKTALAATLHERAPKEEVLLTLLVEVEHTLNSRPLTHVSTSADDEDALTPNHFLLGGPSRVPLPGAFAEGDTAGRKEWRASQWLADCFWRRWVTEYLPQLQHRREPRATHGVIKLEDLVLVADGNLPRNSWPRGAVVATYPGPDGEIRAVDVRTNKGILRRPTKKLVILPIEQRELELNTA